MKSELLPHESSHAKKLWLLQDVALPDFSYRRSIELVTDFFIEVKE